MRSSDTYIARLCDHALHAGNSEVTWTDVSRGQLSDVSRKRVPGHRGGRQVIRSGNRSTADLRRRDEASVALSWDRVSWSAEADDDDDTYRPTNALSLYYVNLRGNIFYIYGNTRESFDRAMN